MTHCACRSRARTGHLTATGPATSTCLHDRWGRVEATQTALGEALVMRRRTRVRFPPPPLHPWVLAKAGPLVGEKPGATANSGGPRRFPAASQGRAHGLPLMSAPLVGLRLRRAWSSLTRRPVGP